MSCNCCECGRHERPEDWERRQDVPQYGTGNLQHEVSEIIPELPHDRRLIQVYCILEYVGTPSNVHGAGVYRIAKCLGFEHLEGRMYTFGYSRVSELSKEQYESIVARNSMNLSLDKIIHIGVPGKFDEVFGLEFVAGKDGSRPHWFVVWKETGDRVDKNHFFMDPINAEFWVKENRERIIEENFEKILLVDP